MSEARKKQRGGRNGSQPVFTREIDEEICRRLATGESLNSICRTQGFPSAPAVKKWVAEDRAGFGTRYALARETGYEVLADEVIALSDDTSYVYESTASAIVQQRRLAVDSRKWLLSKVLPKIYGDRVEVTGDPDAPILHRIELVPVAPKVIEPKVIEHEDE